MCARSIIPPCDMRGDRKRMPALVFHPSGRGCAFSCSFASSSAELEVGDDRDNDQHDEEQGDEVGDGAGARACSNGGERRVRARLDRGDQGEADDHDEHHDEDVVNADEGTIIDIAAHAVVACLLIGLHEVGRSPHPPNGR